MFEPVILGEKNAKPVKAKFMSGFNLGVRHFRRGSPMSDIDRKTKTPEFQAGYGFGLAWGRVGDVAVYETTNRINETWAAYRSGLV